MQHVEGLKLQCVTVLVQVTTEHHYCCHVENE